MKTNPKQQSMRRDVFQGGAWVGVLVAAVVCLGSLNAETPQAEVSDEISEDKSNADDVESSLNRRKRLDGVFADWDAPDWFQAFDKRRDEWLELLRLDIGATYDVAGLAAFGGDGPEYGLSGDLTVSGTWGLIDDRWRRPLDLVFRFRSRRGIGGQSASEVAAASGGLAWNLIDGFNNAGFEIPDFYLLQYLPKHDLTIRYGQMTIDSHFDRHSLRSSKQAFLNRAFSSNPAVAFPRFGAGAIVVWKPEDRGFDLSLGATTVQGTQNGDQVDFDLGSGDFFTAIQAGRDFKMGDRPARVQAMIWHSDAVEDTFTPSGYGFSATFEYRMPESRNRLFVRGAYAHGRASEADRMIAAGFAVEHCENDLFGFAAGLGRDSFGDKDWQVVLESFYRWQIGPSFQVTPEAQVVFGNGLTPSYPFRIVLGLRAEIAF